MLKTLKGFLCWQWKTGRFNDIINFMENNAPIRIAQIMGKWLGGGVESVVMNYFRNIDRTKIQFDFLCDSDSTCIPVDEIQSFGGRVIMIPPYQKAFEYRRALIRIFKENNYQIVHSHISTMSIFPLSAAKSAGVPVRIAHSHSTTNKAEFKKNLLKQILRPFSKVFATHYFCCSELAGRWLFGNKSYNKGKVFLLNNAIDLEKFAYNNSTRLKKRKELGIAPDTFVIGHLGRFMPQKNHQFLVEIFKCFHQKFNNSKLLLVGTGPLVEQIQNQVNQYQLQDCIQFLGQRNDSAELYQAFDCFILPSLYEGLPVVLVEAQAAGLPCITSTKVSSQSKISSCLEFAPLGDAQNWAKLISSLVGKEREDTTQQCTTAGYSIKENARILAEKYQSILPKP